MALLLLLAYEAVFTILYLVLLLQFTVCIQQYLPLDEKYLLGSATNPYGLLKVIYRRYFRCLYLQRNPYSTIEDFNPIGAHSSGLIGE